ncbi:MAG: hypothetical protein KAJ43_11895 [Gemmatimonadetes bacterium]|nr:hypothetical protein [Gemmatimonadota bacterium]
MLSNPHRCPDCDYTWSRYLDFLSCPKCGTNVPEARVGRELSRTKRLGLIGLVMGIVFSVLAILLELVFR